MKMCSHFHSLFSIAESVNLRHQNWHWEPTFCHAFSDTYFLLNSQLVSILGVVNECIKSLNVNNNGEFNMNKN